MSACYNDSFQTAVKDKKLYLQFILMSKNVMSDLIRKSGKKKSVIRFGLQTFCAEDLLVVVSFQTDKANFAPTACLYSSNRVENNSFTDTILSVFQTLLPQKA